MMRFFLLLLGGVVFAVSGWGRDVVFAAYNVENYAPVAAAGGKPGKTEASAAAVVQVVGEIRPDILGVCEMGPRPQFDDFRSRLEAARLGYVDAEWVDGADPSRHLALVSRFPIVARQSAADIPYESDGARLKVRRGFLDVTVEIAPGRRVRIVGAHLKSRLALPGGGNADLERRQEAHLLRKHLDAILAAAPSEPLLVFGDFNDTKEQAAIQEILGPRGTVQALTALPLADAQGDRWTYFWKANDTYARIDFLLVNRALAPWVDAAHSGVHRSPAWNVASDHRPVYATFRFPAPALP